MPGTYSTIPLPRRLSLGLGGLAQNPAFQRLPLSGKVQAAVKALPHMVFASNGGGLGTGYYDTPFSGLWGTLPGSQYDYLREVGDPALNAPVSIGLNWIADNFTEPLLQVSAPGANVGDARSIIPEHPLVQLLRRPNPYYDGDALWQATTTSYNIDGNAYWLKVRGAGGYGRPLQLWFVPHWQIRPRYAPDGSEFLGWYDYQVNGRIYKVDAADVVHFRFGLDYYTGGRLGGSRLKPILREIFTDNEISTYTASIMRNFGCPAVLITPLPDGNNPVEVDGDARKELEALYQAQFTGEGRGKPLIPSVPMDVKKLSFSPEEMALDKIGQRPEARICAALRLPPQVLGLSVGLEHATYSNYETAQKAAYHNCLIPMQRRMAGTLDLQLLPDLDKTPGLTAVWDYDQIQALQPDQTAITEQATKLLLSGAITRAAAKTRIGEPVDEATDRVYYIPVNVRVVPEEQVTLEEESEPETAPDVTEEEEPDGGQLQ